MTLNMVISFAVCNDERGWKVLRKQAEPGTCNQFVQMKRKVAQACQKSGRKHAAMHAVPSSALPGIG